MNHSDTRLFRIVGYIILICFLITIMYLGRIILIPVAFALLLSTLLYPLTSFFERKLPRIPSIILAFLAFITIIAGIGFFFGTQMYGLFENLMDFSEKIRNSFEKYVGFVDERILGESMDLSRLVEKQSDNFLAPGGLVENAITTSTGFLASIALVLVYSFLFLLYRSSFEKLILFHFPDDKREEVSRILLKIQKVAQNYFFGLFIIIVILGTLNGFGLWFIGLDYPFLFGYFAALLAIIPYIGTFIGGLLPFLYALINYDNIWIAILVILWYGFVQAIEGNILTPKIVGSKVSLNPLIAILALLTGGLIWGIAGMVLFIPIMAVLKVLFDNVKPLKPYGLLLGSKFGKGDSPIFKKVRRKKSEKEAENESLEAEDQN